MLAEMTTTFEKVVRLASDADVQSEHRSQLRIH